MYCYELLFFITNNSKIKTTNSYKRVLQYYSFIIETSSKKNVGKRGFN